MGVILKKPVYQILGAQGPTSLPVYSGMIYIDELPYKEVKGGIGSNITKLRLGL